MKLKQWPETGVGGLICVGWHPGIVVVMPVSHDGEDIVPCDEA